MSDKSEKTKARLPRGFIDRSPDDIRALEGMMAKIRAVYELYGFEPADQPLIEYTDALGKFLPDQDRPNEGVFSFQDDDEQWLSLRYDLTAPMARYVAENYEKLPKPFRSYRSGWVFRNEKPGPGRFRQFMQFDADTVGTPGVAADAEMCMMMADVLEALGLYELNDDGTKRPLYVIRVNNRKVLDGVLEAIGLGGDENAGRRLTVLRTIDKKDKMSIGDLFLLLTTGRMDESGDFTKGAGLTDSEAKIVINFVTGEGETWSADNLNTPPTSDEYFQTGTDLSKKANVDKDKYNVKYFYNSRRIIENWEKLVATSSIGHEGCAELSSVLTIFESAGYGSRRIRIDPSVVRGLEYYTGPVYEAELLAEIPNEDGVIVRFGSVGGGGRYDGLVSRFRGEPVPATGFSIGVSRLMTALKNLGKLDTAKVPGPVVVLAMDRDTDSLGRYQKMVGDLRRAGIRAEMYLGGAGMKAQMKYADRRGAPLVVIQGSSEREAGEVQIKDMALGEQLSKNITDNAEWRSSRPAQVTVPQDDLVARVREMLDAQASDSSGS